MATNQPPTIKKFGTFLGVYLPSLLTILGLIMYLRFGWVVGNVGLGYTVLIVLLASSITFITGLSASAIATNMQVGVGGEYFLISRSLGLEPGGAIGIPLYLCRTLSVTFYSFGLAEAIFAVLPATWAIPSYGVQLFAAVIIILVTLLSGRSAALVLKLQIPIMILVGLSIVALAIGVFTHEIHAPEWTPTYRTAPKGFWYVFAVFFPAVTGFTAGIGMSGDLENPRESIPRGTIGAVVTGAAVYVLIPVLFAITGAIAIDKLADPNLGVGTWTQIAFMGGLFVFPAVWGAILSSAFGSILGGPRILQALSNDGLAPKFLSKLSKTGQPTTATWISGAIALLAVSLGELNTIAKFVSVLFLTLYVAVNLSAAIEYLVKEPSYRPKIHVPWYVSLVGAIGALAVMYLISPIAFVFAIILEIALLVILKKRALEQQWGDVGAGFWLKTARYALLQLSRKKISSRNWRPLMLLFVQDVKDRIQLVKLAAALGQNSGVLTISKLIVSQGNIDSNRIYEEEKKMGEDLKEFGLEAFCEVNVVPELHNGILQASKAHGIAGLKTNTIVFGWSEEKAGKIAQLEFIRDLAKAGKNIILAKFNQPPDKKKHLRIDVWWSGRENNADLMLLLAYMLKLNVEWENAVITILSVANDEIEKETLLSGIEADLPKARIQAEVDITVRQPNQRFVSILHDKSKEADIVFLGLMVPIAGKEAKLADKLDKLSSELKTTIFVQNNGMSHSVPLLLKT